jgi:hypothetical protein
LAIEVSCGVMESSAPAEVSAAFCGSGAPLTVKLDPGSDSNAALSDGLLTQSWAQASRAYKVPHMLRSSFGIAFGGLAITSSRAGCVIGIVRPNERLVEVILGSRECDLFPSNASV